MRAALFALLMLSLLPACPGRRINEEGPFTAFAGRSKDPVDFSSEPRAVTTADYKKIGKRWTRASEHYLGPDNRVFVSSTYSSWEFREVRVARLAKAFNHSEGEAEAMRAEERASAEQWHEFFVKFYVQPKKMNDLHEKDSQWKVSLLDDAGHEIVAKPENITRISEGERSMSSVLRALYDFYPIDDYGVYYLIRFPRTLPDGTPIAPSGPGGRLTLRFNSTLDRTELNWLSK